MVCYIVIFDVINNEGISYFWIICVDVRWNDFVNVCFFFLWKDLNGIDVLRLSE